MEQNLLYVFEFIIEDLCINKPNECAPEEYCTCAEISFRSNVFVTVWDYEFANDESFTQKRIAKCCLFNLQSAVTDDDKLLIEIYKKKNDRCKFFLGKTDVSVKSIFDAIKNKKTSDSQGSKNETEENKSEHHGPNDETSSFKSVHTIVSTESSSDSVKTVKKPWPITEMEKLFLPIYNLKSRVIGNLIFIVRLTCMGENIVSPYTGEEERCKKFPTKHIRNRFNCCDCNGKTKKLTCEEIFGRCSSHEEFFPEIESKEECIVKMKQDCFGLSNQTLCKDVEQRFPYVIESRKNSPAYDEFEANMNQAGLTIRVLKNSYKVSDVDCGSEIYEPIPKKCKKKCKRCQHSKSLKTQKHSDCCKRLCKSSFLRNFLQKNTVGRIENRQGLPKIHGNLKYPGNNNHYDQRPLADESNPKKYRKTDRETRTCCLQVFEEDIDNRMKNLNHKIPNGIEICRKGATDSNTDVFLLKLGKKQHCQDKQNLIEIELKTPKFLPVEPKQKITRDTQIDEEMLNAAQKTTEKTKIKKPVKGKINKINKIKGKR